PSKSRSKAAAPPKASRPSTTRGKAPAHSNAGGKGKAKGQAKAQQKRPGAVNKLLRGIFGG
ncbi:MAG: hypothetical protein Q8Q02_01740, partial [Nocardioides sp.]|nr:hypothetical protein [Nocardioides sp.]